MADWAWAIAFQPTDKDGGTSPAAVPVGDMLGASINYGKSGDALAYSGGSMTLSLNNNDSKYTPGGGGTYTNAEWLGTTVKLTANVTGAGAPSWSHGAPAAFKGVVTDISWSFDNRYESTMSVTVSDALTMLGTLSFASVDSGDGLDIGAGDASVTLSAVLAAANAVSSQITQTTILNPSGDTGQAISAIGSYVGTAGALLQLIEQSDGGDVYVRHGLPVNGTNAYNVLAYRTRGQVATSEAISGITGLYPLNLWDASLTTSGDEPHTFANVDFGSGSTASYSQADFTREGGSSQKATVAGALINQFGARVIQRSGLLTADATVTMDLALAFLNQYGVGKLPPLATRGIRMPPIVEGTNSGYELVKYSVGDGCTLRFRPAGASATILVTGIIAGISWAITPRSATLTVKLEDGDQSVSFILDSAVSGILDVNRIA